MDMDLRMWCLRHDKVACEVCYDEPVRIEIENGHVRLLLKPVDKMTEADLLWEKNTVDSSW